MARSSSPGFFLQDLEQATADYLDLRRRAQSTHIATLDDTGLPHASYSPFVRLQSDYYLYLSRLAAHTRNLLANPAIGLLLVEDEGGAGNIFARKRITLQGRAQRVAREETEFATALSEFRRRFGKVMELIEPLPDFYLFRVTPDSGRFVRGFGQAYELVGEDLERLRHIDPRN